MHAPNNGSGLTNASSATIVRDAGVGNGAVGNGIIVRDLVKTYIVADTDKDPLGLRGIKNTIRAVDGLNLTVPHNQIFCLLGPYVWSCSWLNSLYTTCKLHQ